MRNLLIWVALFAAGLLVGFIPQYMKALHFESQANLCNSSLQLAQVRRAAALTYVSASQLNYGNATNYANQLFDQAQQAMNSSSDPNLRSVLNDVLSSRDKITTDLAKGNSQALTDLQPIVLKVEGVSQ